MTATKEIKFQPSTIETIDYAVYRWLDEEMNLSTNTKDGFKKVDVIWSSAERAFLSKEKRERHDARGTLNFPLISVERTSMQKDPEWKGTAYANIPQVADAKGGSLNVARRIMQKKTANFENTLAKKKRGQLNYPRKPSKTVYETMSIPQPIYIRSVYDIKIRTQYQQQMNEIVTPFITKPGGVNYVLLKHDGHRFEGFIQQDFAQNNNVSNMATDERTFETTISLRVLGYLIGGDKNEEKPKMVIRENAVDVKITREYVIFDDKIEHGKKDHDTEYRGIENANKDVKIG